MEILISALIMVIAFLFYSYSDNSKFSQCLDQYKIIGSQNLQLKKKNKELQEQIDSLRTQILGLKTKNEEVLNEIGNVQDHYARLRDGQQALSHKHDVLRAESKNIEIIFSERKSEK